MQLLHLDLRPFHLQHDNRKTEYPCMNVKPKINAVCILKVINNHNDLTNYNVIVIPYMINHSRETLTQ